MKKLCIACSLAVTLAGLAFPANAQFLGYVSPQTTQQTLATATACTGSAQVFTTANLGQTQHFVTAVLGGTSIQTFVMEIDGVDNAGNVYRISDVQRSPIAAGNTNAALAAAGYYPKVQVKITCTANTATFTLNYSGASSTNPVNAGSYANATIDKLSFNNTPVGLITGDTYQTPFGNASGTLVFQYVVSGSTGASLGLGCTGLSTIGAYGPFPSLTLTSLTNPQTFTIPPQPCPFITITYNDGSGGGTRASLEYIFNAPGTFPAVGLPSSSTGTPALGSPCESSGNAKLSTPINIASATTTSLVGINGAMLIYPCSYSLTLSGTTSPTFLLEYGTGATCGTGTVALTGAYLGGAATAPTPIVGGELQATTASQRLCAVTGGTAPNAQGELTYIQQ
jgi:hypothetical protein